MELDGLKFQASRPLLRELSADRLNRIVEQIRRNKPLPGRNVSFRQEGNGIRIDAIGAGGTSSAVPARQPWDIFSNGSENGNVKLRVQPGTISGILPTNWQTVLTVDTPIAEEELVYGIVLVSTDGINIIGATVTLTIEPPTPQEATPFALPETVQVIFGLFKDGVNYNLTGGKDISVSGKNVLVTTPEPPYLVGAPAYDLWFKLA